MRVVPAILLFLFSLSVGCSKTEQSGNDATDGAASVQADYYYDGAIALDPATGSVSAEWEITYFNTDADQLTFLLSPSMEGVSVAGDDVASFEQNALNEFGGLTGVIINLAPGERQKKRRFTISYQGALDSELLSNKINMISPEKIELTVDSFWSPFDARTTKELTGKLVIKVDGDWTIVTPGDAEKTIDGFLVFFSHPTLDMPVMLLNAPREDDAPGYKIFDTRTEPGKIEPLKKAAAFCTNYLNAAFGAENPLPVAKIVIHDRQTGGYSRKTVISLTDISNTDDERLFQFVCHELAHYWSAGANFNSSDYWLTESFADYVAMMAMRKAFGEKAFFARLNKYRDEVEKAGDAPPVWSPENPNRAPDIVNYRKGPLALAELERKIGEGAFNALLTEYMTRPINTTPDLLEALETISGPEARAEFEKLLAT